MLVIMMKSEQAVYDGCRGTAMMLLYSQGVGMPMLCCNGRGRDGNECDE